jgi:hypothetical protein
MLIFDVNGSMRQEVVKNVIRAAIKEVIAREVKLCVAKIEGEVMKMMPRIELEVVRSMSDYGCSDDINVILKNN